MSHYIHSIGLVDCIWGTSASWISLIQVSRSVVGVGEINADTLFVFIGKGKRFKKRVDTDADNAIVDNPF